MEKTFTGGSKSKIRECFLPRKFSAIRHATFMQTLLLLVSSIFQFCNYVEKYQGGGDVLILLEPLMGCHVHHA